MFHYMCAMFVYVCTHTGRQTGGRPNERKHNGWMRCTKSMCFFPLFNGAGPACGRLVQYVLCVCTAGGRVAQCQMSLSCLTLLGNLAFGHPPAQCSLLLYAHTQTHTCPPSHTTVIIFVCQHTPPVTVTLQVFKVLCLCVCVPVCVCVSLGLRKRVIS